MKIKVLKTTAIIVSSLSLIASLTVTAYASNVDNEWLEPSNLPADYKYGAIMTMTPLKLLGYDDRKPVNSTDPKYNSTVNLISYLNEDHMYWQTCTGTVISKRLVLTSAHCLWNDYYDEPLNDYMVIPGRHEGRLAEFHNYDEDPSHTGGSDIKDLYPYGTYKSKTAIIPEVYKTGNKAVRESNDWGLVILDEDIDAGVNIPKIEALSDAEMFKDPFKEVFVLGYPMDKKYNVDDGSIIHEDDRYPDDGLLDFADSHGIDYELSISYGIRREQVKDDNNVVNDKIYYSLDNSLTGGMEGSPMRTAEGIVGIFSGQDKINDDNNQDSYRNRFTRITPSLKKTLEDYIKQY